jgi:hypothetical protein
MECRVSSIADLIAQADVLHEIHQRFLKDAEQLAHTDELAAFGDTGHASSALSALGSDRSEILDKSGVILHLLSASCKDATSQGCELQRITGQIRDRPPSTIPEVLVCVTAMREKAERVQSSAQCAIRALEDLNKEAEGLTGLLGRAPICTMPSGAPCHAIEAMNEQKRLVNGLRQELSAEILKRRELLGGECDELGNQYGLGSGSRQKDLAALYADLKSRIAGAKDLDDTGVCNALLQELRTQCSASERCDPRRLASQLQKDPEAFQTLLDLCRALLNQGVPEVAYLLLHVRQHMHPLEEITAASDQALSLLIESACAAGSRDLPLPTVWQQLCRDPWLLGIQHGDVDSADLRERIIAALLIAALGGQAEPAAAILVRIGSCDLSQPRFPQPVDEVLQALVARRGIRIAALADLTENKKQEIGIRESVASEGGRFRHVQCPQARHFAHFESVSVFPALVRFWEEVYTDLRSRRYDAALRRVSDIDVTEWYAELVRNADDPVEEHPRYSAKIRAFVQSFMARVETHVRNCQSIWEGDDLVIVEADFLEALKQWAGAQELRTALMALATKQLGQQTTVNAQPNSVWQAFALCPSVISRCPRFVTWFCAQPEPEATTQLEDVLLMDLTEDRPITEVARILDEGSAWRYLAILPPDTGLAPNPNWNKRLQQEIDELTSRRGDVQKMQDAGLLGVFESCMAEGRLPAARQLEMQCIQRGAEEREQQREGLWAFVGQTLSALDAVKDRAASANMPTTWIEAVCTLAAKAEMQLRRLKRLEDSDETLSADLPRLSSAAAALSFVVDQQTHSFDEAEQLLHPLLAPNALQPAPAVDKSLALSRCPDLHGAWAELARDDASEDQEMRRVWAQFVGEFAKACNLYHDERDEKKRFAMVPLIKYPFTVYQTAFYKPQSEFLKRPVRLYLYRQRDVDLQALQRLEAELSGDGAAAWLHIVFAPQGYDRIQRFFKYDTGFKDFLLLDEEFLFHVSLAEKHEVPVRQALHASVVDLANSSPFVAQGYCHQTNNIYVGRKDVLQKLLITPQSMIWGGRRIGKTSVLHALGNSLRNRGYRVAYVYADIPDDGDPDLAVARKVAATLELSPVENHADLERQLSSLRVKGNRVALLIDEVDEYIKKSRELHGDKFPLATTLRQVVMEDPAKETILVFSGYHQLYYEARLDSGKQRQSHPFVNIAQAIPIRDLNYDDVKELVKTGFEEMLDIEVRPEVAPLILRRASGHPAFVQQFCRCLLERVSKRRSPRKRITVTAEDVEAVYAANTASEDGEPPFIFYVNETLGYNLSHLGRATMLAICYLYSGPRETQNEGNFLSVPRLQEELNTWCELAGVAAPESAHIAQTVELLEMTNMLTRQGEDQGCFRLTYPTYSDILRRLDKLGKTAIEHSLQKYDSKERQRGVLL